MQSKLEQPKLRTDMLNSAMFLKKHAMSNGKLGVTGFCWGGRITWLYSAHSKRVKAGVAWYGRLQGQNNAIAFTALKPWEERKGLDNRADTLAGKAMGGKVDVDSEGALAEEFEVQGIPTLIVFKGAKETGRSVGATQAGPITELLTGGL